MSNNLTKIDPVPIIILGVSLLVGTLLVFFYADSKSSSEKEKTSTQQGDPKITLSENQFVLKAGVIIRQKDINIDNNGQGTLVISRLSTSSKAVSAQIFQVSNSGPLFSGRSTSDWQARVAPKETAVLRITFDKNSFNWSDPPDQRITFRTNDPEKPEVSIIFSQNTYIPEEEETESAETSSIDPSIFDSDQSLEQ